MIDRKIADFCAGLQSAAEPWYRMTSKLHKKNCPFEAGHVEKFDMMPIASASRFANFALIGKYRVTFLSYFTEGNGGEVTDCMRVSFEIRDV